MAKKNQIFKEELAMRAFDDLLTAALAGDLSAPMDEEPLGRNEEEEQRIKRATQNVCPNCGTHIEEKDEVALLLTPPGSSALKRATCPEVLVIVCSNCRILFFDKLNYAMLNKMKGDG